jgi:hypothetical protein
MTPAETIFHSPPFVTNGPSGSLQGHRREQKDRYDLRALKKDFVTVMKVSPADGAADATTAGTSYRPKPLTEMKGLPKPAEAIDRLNPRWKFRAAKGKSDQGANQPSTYLVHTFACS